MSQSTSILEQIWNYFFHDEPSEPRRILATGKWREFSTRKLLLEAALKHPITCLSQDDEVRLI